MRNFLLLFLLFSSVAYAEWTKTGFGDESTMFINTKTIKKSGDLVRVTYLQNFPLGTSSDDKKYSYKSSKTVQEFDCKKGLSRTISFEWFSDVMGGGKKVYKDVHTYPFERYQEDSLMSSVKRKVCE